MKSVHIAMVGAFLFVGGCGGSSSETPMPLEPVPHSGPEPSAENDAKVEETNSDSSQDAPIESDDAPLPSTAEDSVAEPPVAEPPVAEPPVAEPPAAEKPAAEKPAAEAPAEEKPAAEAPAAEKPAPEKPAAE